MFVCLFVCVYRPGFCVFTQHDVWFCRYDDKGCVCRKPGTQFLKKSYLRGPKGFPTCQKENKDYQAGGCAC